MKTLKVEKPIEKPPNLFHFKPVQKKNTESLQTKDQYGYSKSHKKKTKSAIESEKIDTEVNNSTVSEYEDEVDSNHSDEQSQESNDDKSEDYGSELEHEAEELPSRKKVSEVSTATTTFTEKQYNPPVLI